MDPKLPSEPSAEALIAYCDAAAAEIERLGDTLPLDERLKFAQLYCDTMQKRVERSLAHRVEAVRAAVAAEYTYSRMAALMGIGKSRVSQLVAMGRRLDGP